jgi:hypothetical protein
MLVPNLYILVAATQHPTNINMVIRIISKLLDSSSQQKALNSCSEGITSRPTQIQEMLVC